MLGFVFLNRKWLSDEKKIIKKLSFFNEMKLPIWFISYPEGSRITPEKSKISEKFCKENGRPPLRNVLFPRTKGFIATVKSFRNSHVKFIYDITLGYYHPEKGLGYPPNVFSVHLLGNLEGYKYFIHVKRYYLKDLPEGDADLCNWLFDRFYEKDAIIETWKKSLEKSK